MSAQPASGDNGPADRRRQLFREAADLAIRLQNDPGNAVTVSTIRTWVARSSDHRSAWDRVAAIHGMAGQALGRPGAEGGLSRRSLMLGGLALAGGAAAGGLALPDILLRLRADHRTAVAEIRETLLSDGSRVVLGPASAIALDFNDTRRDVHLLRGMGFFIVSPDAARPFTVHSDRVTARALGTRFEMSNDADMVSVSVDHGLVEVRFGDQLLDDGAPLTPGDWLTLTPDAGTASRGQRDPGDVAAWRRGMLIAERETVGALVARIARWHPGRVVIADPGLARRQVSGVFDLTQPFGALQAAVRPFGARVRQITPLLTVISPI